MAPLLDFIWLCLALPTWTVLESTLPTAFPPTVHTSEPKEEDLEGKLVLYRDKDGLCPYSEQVWLALEVKGLDYVTVLTDDADSFPKLQWPDGTVQTESLKILERIQKEFSEEAPNFYPKISQAVDSVRCNIVRFKGVFPRNTDPTFFAPYLFRATGELVPKSDHMVTIEETEEILEEYYTGPFLCGHQLTAADIVWAPFLERYAAQVPLVFFGEEVEPRSNAYEALKEWYEAMESLVPSYSCRVQGDRTSWANLLVRAAEEKLIPDVELLPFQGQRIPTDRRRFDANAVWKKYAENKPYVAATPEKECAAFLIRNRDAIVQAFTTTGTKIDVNEVDDALREVVSVLDTDEEEDDAASKLSGDAQEMVSFLDETYLRTPRDMGVLPAAAIRKLAIAVPQL